MYCHTGNIHTDVIANTNESEPDVDSSRDEICGRMKAGSGGSSCGTHCCG
jgi:hypothetical protein